MGGHDPVVRAQCLRSFRLLVPLAPLAREQRLKRAHRQSQIQAQVQPIHSRGVEGSTGGTSTEGTSTEGNRIEGAKAITGGAMAMVEHLLSGSSPPDLRDAGASELDSTLAAQLRAALLSPGKAGGATSAVNEDIDEDIDEDKDKNKDTDNASGSKSGSRGAGAGTGAWAGAFYLRDYQWAGVSWITHLRRCGLSGVLADEMGLGKTMQALCSIALWVLEQRHSRDKLAVPAPNVNSSSNNSFAFATGTVSELDSESESVSLVVCPASVCLFWITETEKRFPADLLRAKSFAQWAQERDLAAQGGGREGKRGEGKGHLLVVASYDTVRIQLGPKSGPAVVGGKHSSNSKGKNKKSKKEGKSSKKGAKQAQPLSETRWEHLVLDEAHLIKNPRTQTSNAVFDLAARSNHRLALTGTPVQNQVEELWSLLHFLVRACVAYIELCHGYLSMPWSHGYHISYRVLHWSSSIVSYKITGIILISTITKTQ